MNKMVAFFLILIVGCQSPVEKYDYQDQTKDKFVADQPDYFNYTIIAINESTLVIAPIPDDLDASYSTETLPYDDESKVEGEKHHISELKLDDRIDVWTNDSGQIHIIKVKEVFDSTF